MKREECIIETQAYQCYICSNLYLEKVDIEAHIDEFHLEQLENYVR